MELRRLTCPKRRSKVQSPKLSDLVYIGVGNLYSVLSCRVICMGTLNLWSIIRQIRNNQMCEEEKDENKLLTLKKNFLKLVFSVSYKVSASSVLHKSFTTTSFTIIGAGCFFDLEAGVLLPGRGCILTASFLLPSESFCNST